MLFMNNYKISAPKNCRTLKIILQNRLITRIFRDSSADFGIRHSKQFHMPTRTEFGIRHPEIPAGMPMPMDTLVENGAKDFVQFDSYDC